MLFTYILLQPWSLILMSFLPVPAIIYAVLYIGYSVWMDRHGQDNVNHSAHLWGAAYGVLFALLVQPAVFGDFLQRLLHPSFG